MLPPLNRKPSIRHWITVRVNDDLLGNKAVIHTLRPASVLVYAHSILGSGERLVLCAPVPEGLKIPMLPDVIALSGVVRKSRPIAAGIAGGCRYEIDVVLTPPSEEWRALFNALRDRLGSRDSERSDAQLRVEFIEPPGVARAMTRNIAEGGAFITTDRDLAVGMLAVVRIALPGVPTRIHAVGRVARVDGGGVGLKFLQLHTGDEALRQYLATAKAEEGIEVVEVTPGSRLTLPESDRKQA